MKINITELIANPINPRTISRESKVRLQQSIMLFPKMLYYRDLTINKSNVVLCGNQRTSVLKEILNTTPLDWMIILQDNEKWCNISENDRENILEYWKNWKENPVVEVSVADLSVEEEKELMYKDNIEFGEYDYDKLQQMYDEINLINFGFDEDLFYNVEEDETKIIKNSMGSKGKSINILTFGKNQIAVNKEEYDKLVEVYEKYVDNTGVDFGFVNYLLNYRKGTNNERD